MTDKTILQQYANFCEDTSWYMHTGEKNAPELAYLILGLVGEAGEFADAFKKVIRDEGFNDVDAFNMHLEVDGKRANLVNELGDVLWYLTRIADFLDLDLNALMVINTYKLYNRLVEKGRLIPSETPWPFEAPTYGSVASMLGGGVVGELPNVSASGLSGTAAEDFTSKMLKDGL